MSLLTSAVFKDFSVTASDGLAVKPTPQGFVPIGGSHCKFRILNDDIAVGATGSSKKIRMLFECCSALAEQHKDDPELFNLLERAIPDEVRRLIIVSSQTDGTWTVIDWDNIESDPVREWGHFDEKDKKYIQDNYPDDCAKYFSHVSRRLKRWIARPRARTGSTRERVGSYAIPEIVNLFSRSQNWYTVRDFVTAQLQSLVPRSADRVA